LDYSLAAALWTGLILGVAGVLDLVYREVDPELWMVGLPLALALGAAGMAGQDYPGPLWLPYLMGGLLAASFLALYWLGLLGGADVWAAVLLWLGVPAYNTLLPSLYGALLYSAPLTVAYVITVSARRCGIDCVVRGVPMEGWRLVEERWWAPRGYRMESDVHELVAVEGLYDRMVRATPLMPLVAFIAVGYIVYLLVGDRPLLHSIGGCGWCRGRR